MCGKQEFIRTYEEMAGKIIICAEYQLAGLPAPYEIEVLHEQWQNLMDQINEWEEKLI